MNTPERAIERELAGHLISNGPAAGDRVILAAVFAAYGSYATPHRSSMAGLTLPRHRPLAVLRTRIAVRWRKLQLERSGLAACREHHDRALDHLTGRRARAASFHPRPPRSAPASRSVEHRPPRAPRPAPGRPQDPGR